MKTPLRRISWIGFLAVFLGSALLVPGTALASGWLESFPEATARAAREGKPILVHFTGSDWCRWCHVLEKEVFHTPRFEAWARDRVVLLLLDFPRRKKQPATLRTQNRTLSQRYGIQGYPTVLFLTPDGSEIGQSGYRKGGPDNWIAEAEAILDTAPVIRPASQNPTVAQAPHPAPTQVTAPAPLAAPPSGQMHAPAHAHAHDIEALAAAAATTLAQRTAHARASSAAVQTRLRPNPDAAVPGGAATVHAPPTRIQESYIRAEAIAFRHRIPLLVALHPQAGGTHALREMESILSHPSVAQASQERLAVVRLTLPLQGTDRVIWNSVARQHGIGDTAVALLDPDGKLLHLEHGGTIRAESFLRGIQPYMPSGTAAQTPVAAPRPTRSVPVYEGGWLEDFAEAQAIAQVLNRPMLVDFTGSDWCGWCVRLTQEIFSTPEFMAYARDRFVLVKLDYPRLKEQPAALRRQNAVLAKRYEIQSFPTVLLMLPDGTPQQRLGYVAGGPEAFVNRLQSVSAMR